MTYRVSDPRLARESVADASQALYRAAQLALRKEVGAPSLEALLEAKADLATTVKEAITVNAAKTGVK